MPERLMGTDCKSVSIAYVGSIPTRPTKKLLLLMLNLSFLANINGVNSLFFKNLNYNLYT